MTPVLQKLVFTGELEKPLFDADIAGGIGNVKFPPDWRLNDAVLRADLLADWITELQEEYELACFELLPVKFLHRC